MHGIKIIDSTQKSNKKSMAVMFKYISGYKMMLEDVDSVHTTADRIVIVHTDGEVNTLMKENVIYFTLCIQ